MIDVQLLDTKLLRDKCLQLVADDRAGGTVIFIGTVRKQTNGKVVKQLEFESFVPMAKKEMMKIAKHVTRQWQALHVVIHHRIGVLRAGEVPVIIAIATPHRKAAFEACQYVIDTLKETVPIWKKEVFDDGEIWVAAHP